MHPAWRSTAPTKVPVARTGTRPSARRTTRRARARRSPSSSANISLDWPTAKRPATPAAMYQSVRRSTPAQSIDRSSLNGVIIAGQTPAGNAAVIRGTSRSHNSAATLGVRVDFLEGPVARQLGRVTARPEPGVEPLRHGGGRQRAGEEEGQTR